MLRPCSSATEKYLLAHVVNEFGYVLKKDRCVLRFSETISVENRSCVSWEIGQHSIPHPARPQAASN